MMRIHTSYASIRMIPAGEGANFDILRDCLSTRIIEKLAPRSGKTKRSVKGRKNEIKPVAKAAAHGDEAVSDAAELADFVEYLAEEIFANLASDLRSLSYATIQDDSSLAENYTVPLDTALVEDLIQSLPLTIADSLSSYGLIDQADNHLEPFLAPVLESYITAAVSPPPEHTPAVTGSRPDGCEICAREHLPLTYHHLIPRQVASKAVKRGWHRGWEVNKVAWLCRACHSYVHQVATNEELAREFYDVEKLLEREDVQKFAAWVGRVRWKAR